MSLSSSERKVNTSNFIKGGGDADSEKKGTVVRTPGRYLKPKALFGQYRSLPRNRGLVSNAPKETTCVKHFSSPKRFKKSVSMEDLTPESRKKENSAEVKRTKSFTQTTMAAMHCLPDPVETTKRLASRRILQTLILNAWRKRRSNAAILMTERDSYKMEIRNLNLQIILLKALLDSEKERSATAVAQLQEVTTMMDEATEELHIVRKDKEEIYTKLACQDMQQQETVLELDHLKKELKIAKSENCALTTKLQRSDEETTSLRGKNSGLLAKVASQDNNIVSQKGLIKNLQQAKIDLEKQLSAQLNALIASKKDQEASREELRRLQDELDTTTAELDVTSSTNNKFALKLQALMSEAEEKEKEIAQLRSRILENELEIKSLSWSCQVRYLLCRAAKLFSTVAFLMTNN